MTSTPSLHELAELPDRVARLEAELAQLRQRLGALESPPAPLTVRQFCDRFGWSENQLRWLLFNREHNGLAEAVCGRGRLLIDAHRFFEILKREKPGHRRRVARRRGGCGSTAGGTGSQKPSPVEVAFQSMRAVSSRS
jgi:hypothetical protein